MLFSNKYQLPGEIRFSSNENGLFGQVLSILRVCACVCVWLQWRYIDAEDQNHEPCWQPAASAARNKTRNKCFMKQTYTSLPYFLVTSFAASSCIQSPRFLHFFPSPPTLLTSKYQTSPPHWCHRTISDRNTEKKMIQIYFEKHVNKSQKWKINKGLKECHSLLCL